MNTNDPAWVPESCTLRAAERPLRAAEFDDLFASALREQRRLTRTRLRWILDPRAECRVRDLIGQETACCSFFSFTLTPSGQGIVVEAEVPEAQAAVLDGLQERAAAGLRT